MPSWTRDETELHFSITTEHPFEVSAYTNWPYYITRLNKCEGFTSESNDTNGGAVAGIIDISEYQYIWLRKNFGSERSETAYWKLRKELPAKPEEAKSAYRAEANEHETHFMLLAAEPYWFKVETDSAVWQRRLDKHPYAVCTRIVEYASSAGDTKGSKEYLFPRSLLTVRKARPKYSEEHREKLRKRMESFRTA